MNPDSNQNEASPAETAAKLVMVTKPIITTRHWAPTVATCLFLLFLLAVLAGVCLPVFNSVALRSPQTTALIRAKQGGLALLLFAGDHDGNFPKAGIPDVMTREPTDSNAAFACLFSDYTQSERIFGNKASAYQTRVPDDIIDAAYTGTRDKTLEPGENVYGYMMGLTDKSDPAAPLVADGTDGSGHYNTFPQVRGGTWDWRSG